MLKNLPVTRNKGPLGRLEMSLRRTIVFSWLCRIRCRRVDVLISMIWVVLVKFGMLCAVCRTLVTSAFCFGFSLVRANGVGVFRLSYDRVSVSFITLLNTRSTLGVAAKLLFCLNGLWAEQQLRVGRSRYNCTQLLRCTGFLVVTWLVTRWFSGAMVG